MICQNCKKNTANVFIKNTINNVTQEYHLCSHCAQKLYPKNSFSIFSINPFGIFSINPFNIFSINTENLLNIAPEAVTDNDVNNYDHDKNNFNQAAHLNKLLKEAIETENYEEAAKIRDKIKNLNKTQKN